MENPKRTPQQQLADKIAVIQAAIDTGDVLNVIDAVHTQAMTPTEDTTAWLNEQLAAMPSAPPGVHVEWYHGRYRFTMSRRRT